MVKLNAGPTDVPCLSNPPESYVLETTTDQLIVVNRAEL